MYIDRGGSGDAEKKSGGGSFLTVPFCRNPRAHISTGTAHPRRCEDARVRKAHISCKDVGATTISRQSTRTKANYAESLRFAAPRCADAARIWAQVSA